MKNRVTELLKIEKPVLEGAMIYICDAKLAAAVSNAGGLGILGPNCHVVDPEPDPVKNAENLRAAIKEVRSLTDKPFSVNFVPSSPTTNRFASEDEATNQLSFSDAMKPVMIEEKVPVALVVSTMDLFEEKLREDIADFKAAGITVIYRDLNVTLETCRKAVELGADALIVTGCEAGGHAPKTQLNLTAILPQVVAALPDTPIIAAGGITHSGAAKAAAAMGAEGVYCGTAFSVVKESRSHENYKKAIFNTKATDLIRWKSSVFDTTLCTIPTFAARVCASMSQGSSPSADLGRQYSGGFRRAMIEGDIDNGMITVSAGIDTLTEGVTAAEMVNELGAAF